ncbi:hypothetical protein Z043_107143 [Scleropages formosus]|uniref:CRAL-TRIO domain-containing protein n=1 Tax=Scleropages formosus TaxID=113540 RepID=A0A0N8K125_SCLFO|nr:hypothetical protein Z043_107143 [Scleropages formosus]
MTLHKRTVHTLYVVQPHKRDVLKLLLKILMPNYRKNGNPSPFKQIFLKEIFELCNYIDRSQLTADFGGYLVYCHHSWVVFLKEIDGFVQEFLSVVHRLPVCIATLQKLSQQPVPTSLEKLEDFCSASKAQFQELRRELGLDELLRHCECVMEKLRYPEKEPCYQAMAGTALFTQTAYEMLQNYSRITSAVEKLELLWQQAFSKAHLQLQVLRLQKDALKIIDLINKMRQEKLQSYRIEIAKDVQKAESLKLEFEASVYTPAMALVRRAEDVIHTLAETVPFGDVQGCPKWVTELNQAKERFLTAVELPHQTLRAVSDFYYYYNKTFCGVDSATASPDCTIPKKRLVVGPYLGRRMCMILRKLLTSPGAVPLHDLQQALQWQYEFFRENQRDFVCAEPLKPAESEKERNCVENYCRPFTDTKSSGSMSDVRSGQTRAGCGALSNLSKWDARGELPRQIPPHMAPGTAPTSAKPPSLSSFDSGFDAAGSTHLDLGTGNEGLCTRENLKPVVKQPHIREDNVASVSDSEGCREDFECNDVGGSSKASIQIIPKITVNALNFEIKVKRSATLPKNPWLSLPVEDLENSYTVTITPNSQNSQDFLESPAVSQRIYQMEDAKQSQEWQGHTDMQATAQNLSTGEEPLGLCVSEGTNAKESILQAQDSFDSEMSPICKVLSSTITDTQEKSSCTADSIPTLLWDTYDFHNIKQDGCDRRCCPDLELMMHIVSAKQEEENVLAQQEMLDLLLKTETTSKQLALWETEEELSKMELAVDGALISAEEGLRSEVSVQAEGVTKLALGGDLVSEETLDEIDGLREFGTPVVLDTGSGLMKAGFADQDLPTTVFPTVIGLPKYEEVMNSNFERETYIGREAQNMRGVLALKYPMKHGIIHNWDEMEKIWHHTFEQLCVDPENHPVLLTEAAMNPRENRQRMVELMFEAFAVPYTYVAMQAVLALYAAGRTTGVVFDSGDGVSHSVPVFEGYCLPHAVQRFALAGADVTQQLRKLLQEQGVAMRTSAELEIVREMKERCCRVSQDYEAELSYGGPASSEISYTMPDGHIVHLSTEQFRAPEILFKPELIGRDHYGIHESIFKSILHSDIDLRKSLMGNIVLSGGNTLLAGLPERLQSEIRNMAPVDLSDCVRVTSPEDRDFSVWSGGAVLARLPSFALAWISQGEYEEFGPQIVFRKCF